MIGVGWFGWNWVDIKFGCWFCGFLFVILVWNCLDIWVEVFLVSLDGFKLYIFKLILSGCGFVGCFILVLLDCWFWNIFFLVLVKRCVDIWFIVCCINWILFIVFWLIWILYGFWMNWFFEITKFCCLKLVLFLGFFGFNFLYLVIFEGFRLDFWILIFIFIGFFWKNLVLVLIKFEFGLGKIVVFNLEVVGLERGLGLFFGLL